MKTKYIIASLALLGVAATSCKDEMDYNEYTVDTVSTLSLPRAVSEVS